jgi:hypothetical protein
MNYLQVNYPKQGSIGEVTMAPPNAAQKSPYQPLLSPTARMKKSMLSMNPQKLMDAESPANRALTTRDLMQMCHEVDRRANKQREANQEPPLSFSEFQSIFQRIVDPHAVPVQLQSKYKPSWGEEGPNGDPKLDYQEISFRFNPEPVQVPRETGMESLIQISQWDVNTSPVQRIIVPAEQVNEVPHSAWSNDVSKSLQWNASPILNRGAEPRVIMQSPIVNYTNVRDTNALGPKHQSNIRANKERLLSSPSKDSSPKSDLMDIGTPEITFGLHRRVQELKVSTLHPRLLNSHRTALDSSDHPACGSFRALK